MIDVVAIVRFDTCGPANGRSFSNQKNKVMFLLTQDRGMASH